MWAQNEFIFVLFLKPGVDIVSLGSGCDGDQVKYFLDVIESKIRRTHPHANMTQNVMRSN